MGKIIKNVIKENLIPTKLTPAQVAYTYANEADMLNAVLINQGKNQKERMELPRQLAVQQLQTLETVSLNNLSGLRSEISN